VAHPGFLKPPPEDELLIVDQLPAVNPDFFSGGAGAGSILWSGCRNSRVLGSVDHADHWGDGAEFHPSSFSSLPQLSLLSLPFFSLRFSIASWELALARSFDCISLNRILWWWAYELQCSSY
jgi:hypothetical protein